MKITFICSRKINEGLVLFLKKGTKIFSYSILLAFFPSRSTSILSPQLKANLYDSEEFAESLEKEDGRETFSLDASNLAIKRSSKKSKILLLV